jgi:DNA polymerase III sliding clamp (beta) subunit (PCNA family)
LEWRFRGERGLGIMARGKKKRDKKWMWVAKPGDKIVVSRTAVIPSKKLSRRDFKVLEEVVNIYSRMLGDVLSHASRNITENYYRLKNGKYQELRSMYPNIPSHYVHGVCQDAVERVSSLRRNKARQYSREIFDELVKHLGLGKGILGVGGSGDTPGGDLGR